MDDGSTPIEELASDDNIRQRLALTLTPEDVSGVVGEAFVLQLASINPSDVGSSQNQIHVGIGLDEPFPAGHVFERISDIFPDDVAILACEATDRGGAFGRVVDGTVEHGPITDPQIKLTALSAVGHAPSRLETAVTRAMSNGTVPLNTENPQKEDQISGGITVAGTVADEFNVDEQLPADSTLTARLDLVVAASIGPALWLDDSSVEQITEIPMNDAVAYLERVQELSPSVSEPARTHLDVIRRELSVSTDPRAEGTCVPTTTAIADTIERLAIASARLELATTVTDDHVETAVRLYDGSLDYRSFSVDILPYWRDCADQPIAAFETVHNLHQHIATVTLERRGPEVTMADFRDVGAEYHVDTEQMEAAVTNALEGESIYRVPTSEDDDAHFRAL